MTVDVLFDGSIPLVGGEPVGAVERVLGEPSAMEKGRLVSRYEYWPTSAGLFWVVYLQDGVVSHLEVDFGELLPERLAQRPGWMQRVGDLPMALGEFEAELGRKAVDFRRTDAVDGFVLLTFEVPRPAISPVQLVFLDGRLLKLHLATTRG